MRAFRRHADRPCISHEGFSATFAETADRTVALGAWLDAHASESRHVAILLGNGREYLESIIACAVGNVVRVPLSTRETFDTIRVKLTESSTTTVICTAEVAAELADWIAVARPALVIVGDTAFSHPAATATARYNDVVQQHVDAAAISRAVEGNRYRLSFTGGTTGVPKAVVQTHRQERAMMRNLLFEVIRPRSATTFVAATPLAHASGAFVVPSLLQGGSVSWLDHFDPERLLDSGWLGPGRRIETFAVPTALSDLAAAAGPGHALESVVYGGAPCPAPVLQSALDRIGDDRLVQVYGQAEAPVTICVASREDHAAGLVVDGWVGHPFMFVDIEIAAGTQEPGATTDGSTSGGEVGEVVVYGEHVMEGYWRRPEESASRLNASGGLLTGDLGRLDARGGMSIVGRSRELIISGGFNVYPDDVENRLRQSGLAGIPLVVFGLPHPRWGEAVALGVERVEGMSDDTLTSRAQAAAETALTYYERPKAIFALDHLPLTSVGKVARQEVARVHADHFDDEATIGSAR